MTTGTWLRDRRYTPHLHGDGGLPYGSYDTKTWAGGDRPKDASYVKPVLVTVTRYYKVLVPIPGTTRKKVIRRPYTFSFYKKRAGVSRPPKRARDVDHSYSMSYSHWEDEPQEAEYQGQFWYQPVNHWNIPYSYEVQNLSFDDNDQIKLIGKLREKMQGSDFNMSLLLGEGHQTLRMIGDTAIRIAKSLHHLRRGDLAGTARSLLEAAGKQPLRPYKQMKPFRPTVDRMSSHWLELQYGWKPLLQDVQAGAEFLAHKLSVPQHQTYRMSIKKEAFKEAIGPSPEFWGATIGRTHREIRRSMIVRVREQPGLIAQLGLLDPEIVAWELLPFSFVADWFIPIGSYLEARAFISHCGIENYVQTTKSVTRDSTDRFASKSVYVTVNRIVASGAPPVPLPRFKPLSQALSVKHCLNGIALLAQAAVGISKTNERNLALTNSLPPSDPRNGLIPSSGEILSRGRGRR